MTDHRPNTYDDDDLAATLSEIEGLEAQKRKIVATAAADCSAIAGKIKEAKKSAKDDLGIPLSVLNPLLKRRKLERKIEEINEGIDDDFQEVWEDACGQFALFAPADRDESSNLAKH